MNHPAQTNDAGHIPPILTTEFIQIPTLMDDLSLAPLQKSPISERQNNRFLHAEYVIYMGDLPQDLRHVIEAWEHLPEAIKVGIVAMVQASIK